MKKPKQFLLIGMILSVLFPVFTACKKGDGDPFISLKSRKARLCNDWKVTSIQQTVKYKTTTITTTFDGSKKTVEKYVKDTIVYWPDTLNYYKKVYTFTGSLYYSFDNTGSYQIDESFSDDSIPGSLYTSQEKGYWYFTGGSKASETKSKELLGLQPNSFVYNPISTSPYSVSWSGQNMMRIYHIYKLSSKEVELRFDTEENTNLFVVVTNQKIILKPRD